MVKIKTVAKVLPPYSRSTAEIIPFIEKWVSGRDERYQRKVIKLFGNAGVDMRYSMLSPEEMFGISDLETRNQLYMKGALDLSEKVLRLALEKSGWDATSLDYIITVSCTGYMIPSMDAYLINKLGLRHDVVRLPVTEMGCVAGVSGLIYAKNFLQSNPGKRAAVIAVESPMATFQQNDFSMVNVVSAAIFGDGAACALLSSDEDAEGPAIVDEGMYHFQDTEEIMGFTLTNSGLLMVLDPSVPDVIADNFEKIITPFLARTNTTLADIDHFIFHPGGKKIVQKVEEILFEIGKDINDTKEVLRLHGNMSSATVLHVLERFMDRNPAQGEKGLMLSFGPGFTAQRILLEW